MTDSGAELRTVTTASHQAEAEMLQSMLRAEGIPSMVRRAGAFDVPQAGAAAPHEVLVPAPDYEAAHALIHGNEDQRDASDDA